MRSVRSIGDLKGALRSDRGKNLSFAQIRRAAANIALKRRIAR